MILRILAVSCLIGVATGGHPEPPPPPDPPEPTACLTGQMVDVQSWTDDRGTIIADTATAEHAVMDLSASHRPTLMLERFLTKTEGGNNENRRRYAYMSMARCNLTCVPDIFASTDSEGQPLYQTLKYVTFFGNQFGDIKPAGATSGIINIGGAAETILRIDQMWQDWDVGFRAIEFPNLVELDLRSCNIQRLNNETFARMPSLRSLYLAQNNIISISDVAFSRLTNLIHLDLSNNMANEQGRVQTPLKWESDYIFSQLPNLTSLDLSHTRLPPNSVTAFYHLGKNFKRLSLCHAGLEYLVADNFKGTSLRYLDVSGNVGILDQANALNGLQHSLKVLYAVGTGLKSLRFLLNFEELLILKASNNEIAHIEVQLPQSWKSLQILDLDHNRLTAWASNLYSQMENLKVLSVRNNQINLMKASMLQDIRNVSFLAVSGNFFVCTCHNRELFEIAANNDKKYGHSNIPRRQSNSVTEYHVGFDEYYDRIENRMFVTRECDVYDNKCKPDISNEMNGHFQLFDYMPLLYTCFVIEDGVPITFSEVSPCNMTRSDHMHDDYIRGGWTKIVIIGLVATVALPLLILGFLFRRSFSYFYITVKNSATLSLMDSKSSEDGSIFNYDVFVSYCNEDRPWVLDQLLPHVEKDGNVSVCLHERDFQVGLSILENIVSCMDRSRSIMLVISQRFLLSQWCQFEMHLAQHRLLETRREDLILILLEDIPRRMRPNILHYLMVTKTYVLWPKSDPSDQAQFWRRLKKSLYMQKMKHAENVSLA